jgi:hypothetical protein
MISYTGAARSIYGLQIIQQAMQQASPLYCIGCHHHNHNAHKHKKKEIDQQVECK